MKSLALFMTIEDYNSENPFFKRVRCPYFLKADFRFSRKYVINQLIDWEYLTMR